MDCPPVAATEVVGLSLSLESNASLATGRALATVLFLFGNSSFSYFSTFLVRSLNLNSNFFSTSNLVLLFSSSNFFWDSCCTFSKDCLSSRIWASNLGTSLFLTAAPVAPAPVAPAPVVAPPTTAAAVGVVTDLPAVEPDFIFWAFKVANCFTNSFFSPTNFALSSLTVLSSLFTSASFFSTSLESPLTLLFCSLAFAACNSCLIFSISASFALTIPSLPSNSLLKTAILSLAFVFNLSICSCILAISGAGDLVCSEVRELAERICLRRTFSSLNNLTLCCSTLRCDNWLLYSCVIFSNSDLIFVTSLFKLTSSWFFFKFSFTKTLLLSLNSFNWSNCIWICFCCSLLTLRFIDAEGAPALKLFTLFCKFSNLIFKATFSSSNLGNFSSLFSFSRRKKLMICAMSWDFSPEGFVSWLEPLDNSNWLSNNVFWPWSSSIFFNNSAFSVCNSSFWDKIWFSSSFRVARTCSNWSCNECINSWFESESDLYALICCTKVETWVWYSRIFCSKPLEISLWSCKSSIVFFNSSSTLWLDFVLDSAAFNFATVSSSSVVYCFFIFSISWILEEITPFNRVISPSAATFSVSLLLSFSDIELNSFSNFVVASSIVSFLSFNWFVNSDILSPYSFNSSSICCLVTLCEAESGSNSRTIACICDNSFLECNNCELKSFICSNFTCCDFIDISLWSVKIRILLSRSFNLRCIARRSLSRSSNFWANFANSEFLVSAVSCNTANCSFIIFLSCLNSTIVVSSDFCIDKAKSFSKQSDFTVVSFSFNFASKPSINKAFSFNCPSNFSNCLFQKFTCWLACSISDSNRSFVLCKDCTLNSACSTARTCAANSTFNLSLASLTSRNCKITWLNSLSISFLSFSSFSSSICFCSCCFSIFILIFSFSSFSTSLWPKLAILNPLLLSFPASPLPLSLTIFSKASRSLTNKDILLHVLSNSFWSIKMVSWASSMAAISAEFWAASLLSNLVDNSLTALNNSSFLCLSSMRSLNSNNLSEINLLVSDSANSSSFPVWSITFSINVFSAKESGSSWLSRILVWIKLKQSWRPKSLSVCFNLCTSKSLSFCTALKCRWYFSNSNFSFCKIVIWSCKSSLTDS